MVNDKKVDIAITVSPPSEDMNIYVEQLFIEDSVFVCRKDSSYANHLKISSLNISNELLFMRFPEFLKWHDYWFGTLGKPALKVSNVPITPNYFNTKDSWAIVPTSVFNNLGDEFKTCTLDYEPPARSVYIASGYPEKAPYFRLIKNVVQDKFHNKIGIQII